jgi:hypothetical protein
MIPWDKLHGAMTHFPIALLMFSTACDFVSVAFKKLSFARGLRLVSFYGLAFAALASLGAVVSGIALTKGDMWGRGDFGWHHRFVWPAFGLLSLISRAKREMPGREHEESTAAGSLAESKYTNSLYVSACYIRRLRPGNKYGRKRVLNYEASNANESTHSYNDVSSGQC